MAKAKQTNSATRKKESSPQLKRGSQLDHAMWLKRTLHSATFGIVGILMVATLGFQWVMNGKVAPNTIMLNSTVSWQNAAEVQEEYSRALEVFEEAPVTVTYRGESRAFSLSELGVVLKKSDSVEGIPVIQPGRSPWGFEGGVFGEKIVRAFFTLDAVQLENVLRSAFITYEVPAEEPRVAWNVARQNIDITPEIPGWTGDLATFIVNLTEHVESLGTASPNHAPLVLSGRPLEPTTHAVDLGTAQSEIIALLQTPLTLKSKGNTWTLVWQDHPDALLFEITPSAIFTESGASLTPRLHVRVHEPFMNRTIDDLLTEALEIEPQNVIIHQDEAGTITFEGTATDGQLIQRESLKRLIEYALNQVITTQNLATSSSASIATTIEIPLKTTPADIQVPDSLRDLGITELVATGYSGYSGSPYNRQHNIRVAIDRFNGALIAPGETFSFGEQLGEVDASTGYAKELVIKEGETIPEYGGGVCQVSSTLFRAILFAGLPVVERHPHSYAVSYYAYPLGWGLDATVYPPQVDLKFLNDTGHHLLIQSYQEDFEAYFKFYGTKDGREVHMDGPFITGSAPAPPPQYTVTLDLAPGEKKKVDSAHNGFTAEWTRTVIYPKSAKNPEGSIDTYTFTSPYKPWAEKWLVGEGTEGF